MTDDNDTVPVSAMGIGDDEVREELEGHAETIREHFATHDVTAVEVNTDLLDGAAHLHLTVNEHRDDLPEDLQNYIVANRLVMLDPRRVDDHLEVRVTTGDIYETWSGMDAPDL